MGRFCLDGRYEVEPASLTVATRSLAWVRAARFGCREADVRIDGRLPRFVEVCDDGKVIRVEALGFGSAEVQKPSTPPGCRSRRTGAILRAMSQENVEVDRARSRGVPFS